MNIKTEGILSTIQWYHIPDGGICFIEAGCDNTVYHSGDLDNLGCMFLNTNRPRIMIPNPICCWGSRADLTQWIISCFKSIQVENRYVFTRGIYDTVPSGVESSIGVVASTLPIEIPKFLCRIQ